MIQSCVSHYQLSIETPIAPRVAVATAHPPLFRRGLLGGKDRLVFWRDPVFQKRQETQDNFIEGGGLMFSFHPPQVAE